MNLDSEKQCTRCNGIFPLENFKKMSIPDKTSCPHGLMHICKECSYLSRFEWHKKFPIEKDCIVCKKKKTLYHFNKSRYTFDSHEASCKECSESMRNEGEVAECSRCSEIQPIANFKKPKRGSNYVGIVRCCLKCLRKTTFEERKRPCRECKELKSPDEYQKVEGSASGYSAICAECLSNRYSKLNGRICYECMEHKEAIEFGVNKHGNLRSRCKSCTATEKEQIRKGEIPETSIIYPIPQQVKKVDGKKVTVQTCRNCNEEKELGEFQKRYKHIKNVCFRCEDNFRVGFLREPNRVDLKEEIRCKKCNELKPVEKFRNNLAGYTVGVVCIDCIEGEQSSYFEYLKDKYM